MSKVLVRTSDVAGFFERAKQAANRADSGHDLDGTVTLAFEDPQTMFTVLSVPRKTYSMAEATLQTCGLTVRNRT